MTFLCEHTAGTSSIEIPIAKSTPVTQTSQMPNKPVVSSHV